MEEIRDIKIVLLAQGYELITRPENESDFVNLAEGAKAIYLFKGKVILKSITKKMDFSTEPSSKGSSVSERLP